MEGTPTLWAPVRLPDERILVIGRPAEAETRALGYAVFDPVMRVDAFQVEGGQRFIPRRWRGVPPSLFRAAEELLEEVRDGFIPPMKWGQVHGARASLPAPLVAGAGVSPMLSGGGKAVFDLSDRGVIRLAWALKDGGDALAGPREDFGRAVAKALSLDPFIR